MILLCLLGKGQNGVSTNGVTANFKFVDGGTFWVLPLTYIDFPKVPGRTFFPQTVNVYITCCSGPISVDPICPQPNYNLHYSIIICLYYLSTMVYYTIHVYYYCC